MIHIACNIDSKYVRYCAVTLTSIFENNKDEVFQIHIADSGLSNDERQSLTKIATNYNSEVHFYTPDAKRLEGFTIKKFSRRITLATYYRCILSDLLPSDIDKVIYLDCDIIVMGSLKPLWETPIDGIGVAAVEDSGCDEEERYQILNYPKEESYFNAGVLLINLKYWREHNVAQACVDYYHKYPERIIYNDQDLLNIILHKDKKIVPLCWNVQDAFYRLKNIESNKNRPQYMNAIKNPVVLHFTNRKPWKYDSQHPMRKEYFRYLALTPWKNDVELNNPINKIKRFFRILPFKIRLRKARYITTSQIKKII